MENNDVIQDIISDFNLLESLYDCVRIVNPVEKKVATIIKDFNHPTNDNDACYDLWVKERVCENCISMRANLHHKSFTKVECHASNIFIITAVPVRENVVIEFMQNIPPEYFALNKKYSSMTRLIEKQNVSIVKNVLTNIYHDKYVFERLPYDIHTSFKEKITIVLFVIEIKNMDYIYSTYGYTVGNQILIEAATALRGLPRHSNDWISNYHGLRFLLVMYGLNENQVGRNCNHIKERIKNINFNIENEPVKIEVHIGYHILKDKFLTPEQFIEKANEMLVTENVLERSDRSTDDLINKYSFTSREKEIISLLLKGKSNAEIAGDLYIGLSTVKKYMAGLFLKMEVKSRTELVAKLLPAGRVS